jgi:quinol monooxygenase YgiN
MPYVSITGLRLKGPVSIPRFWWHALRSMAQAKAAPGNIRADARNINGVQHTLTVWTDEAAMRAYLVRGAHLQAMRAFHSIATGKTIGFTSETVPSWPEARAIWEERGRDA